MRLLIDQDVYAATIAALVAGGHDVQRASEIGLARADDSMILEAAAAGGRVLVTRDLDFGRLVQGGQSPTVIILRAPFSALPALHLELLRTLSRYGVQELAGAIVIVEPGRHRLRRLVPPAAD